MHAQAAGWATLCVLLLLLGWTRGVSSDGGDDVITRRIGRGHCIYGRGAIAAPISLSLGLPR